MKNGRALPLVFFMIGLCLMGCKKEQSAEPSPVEIVVISGANQKANVGARLPKPVVIGVQYAGGVLISFADVSFKTADGKVTPSQTQTLQEGSAEVDWVLGKTAGRQILNVIVKDHQGKQVATKRINATAVALITDPTGLYTGTAVFRQTGVIPNPQGKPISFKPNYVSLNIKTQGNKITGKVSLIQNNASVPFLPGGAISGLTDDIEITGTLTGNKVHLLDKSKSDEIEVTGTLSADGMRITGKITRWPKSGKPDRTNFRVAKYIKK